MGGLIEPNIHPVFVHFAFALVVTSAAAYLLALVLPRRRETLLAAADWMLAFGALAILATVAAGFQAYYSVAHDTPSHAAMTTHRNWAVPTALFVLALAAWRWRARAKAPSALSSAFVAVAALLLTTTAWWGRRLVYGYGLERRQPPANPGEGHDHAGVASVRITAKDANRVGRARYAGGGGRGVQRSPAGWRRKRAPPAPFTQCGDRRRRRRGAIV